MSNKRGRPAGTKNDTNWMRDALIARQFHKGVSVCSIARHWNITEARVYKILSKLKEKEC